MTEKLTNIQIEPLAQPYKAFIPVEEEEVQKLMDEYWDLHKDALIRNVGYKGKKQKGGKPDYRKARAAIEKRLGLNKVYAKSFADLAATKVVDDTDEEIIFINSAAYYNDDQPLIVMNFFFYPKLTMDYPLDYKMERIEFDPFEKEYEVRVKDLKWKKRTRETIEEIAQDSEVIIDVTTTKDGDSYAPETLRNYRKEVNFLELKPVADSLPGKKVGDYYEIEDQRQENLFKYAVKIHEAYKLIIPEDTDLSLFENQDFSNMDEFKENCQKEYEKNNKDRTDEYVYANLIDQAIKKGNMEAIPQKYLDLAVENLMEQHGSKNDKLVQHFGQQVIRSIVQRMTGDWYIRTNGLKRESEYEDIVEDMLKKVEWVEPEASEE